MPWWSWLSRSKGERKAPQKPVPSSEPSRSVEGFSTPVLQPLPDRHKARTAADQESIELSRSIDRDSTNYRRDSTRVEEVSIESRALVDSSGGIRVLKDRDGFLLGLGYGSFQSTLNDVWHRVAAIQETLEKDIAKEVTVEEVAERLDTLARVWERSAREAPPELAREAKDRLEAATLSTRLLQVFAIVKEKQVITPNGLAAQLNLKANTCSQYLNHLADRGHISRMAYGKYGAKATGETPPQSEHPAGSVA
jgi:ribosomal protein S25